MELDLKAYESMATSGSFETVYLVVGSSQMVWIQPMIQTGNQDVMCLDHFNIVISSDSNIR